MVPTAVRAVTAAEALNGVTNALLTLLINDGYPLLFATVLVSALGAPLPASVLLLAAGAFAAAGELNMLIVVPIAVTAAVAGDCAVYLIARTGGERALQRLGPRIGIAPERVTAIGARIGNWMWGAIVMTRWLLTPAAVPVDIVAGLAAYSVHGFIAGSVAGEALWVVLYTGAGFLLGGDWTQVLGLLRAGAGLLSGVAIVIGTISLAVKLGWFRRTS